MWSPKPEIPISLELCQIGRKFQRLIWGLVHAPHEETVPWRLRRRPTTGNSNKDLWTPILQFLAVDRCRNHLSNLMSSSSSSRIPNLALEFRRYLSEFQRCNYFRFWGTYRYFRLSFDVVLTSQNYFPPTHCRKPQICRWNFNCTFHSFRDISVSGFGRHFPLSVFT